MISYPLKQLHLTTFAVFSLSLLPFLCGTQGSFLNRYYKIKTIKTKDNCSVSHYFPTPKAMLLSLISSLKKIQLYQNLSGPISRSPQKQKPSAKAILIRADFSPLERSQGKAIKKAACLLMKEGQQYNLKIQSFPTEYNETFNRLQINDNFRPLSTAHQASPALGTQDILRET